MKNKNLLLISVIISFIVIIFGLILLRTQFVLEKIRVAFENQLEKQIKHDVNIEKISGNVLSGLKAENFRVDDYNIDKSLIAAKEVDINYKLFGLIRGKFLITDLHFKELKINAYVDENGELNLKTLIPKRDKSDSTFKLLVSRFTIEDGQLDFTDLQKEIDFAVAGFNMAVKGPLNSWNHSGKFSFANGQVEWNNIKSKIDQLSTDFHISQKKGKITLKTNIGNSWLVAIINAMIKSTDEKDNKPVLDTRLISEINLEDFQQFIPDNKVAGKILINVILNGTIPDISGKIALKSPAIQFNDVKFDDIEAQAGFDQNSFQMSKISGKLAGGKFNGNLSLNITDETLSYDSLFQLVNLDSKKLLPMLTGEESNVYPEIDGLINCRLEMQNAEDNPDIVNSFPQNIESWLRANGNIEFTDCSINDVKIADSKAYYEIKGGELSLDANFDEAEIKVRGKAGISSALALDLDIDRIDTKKLSKILNKPEFSGIGVLKGKLTRRSGLKNKKGEPLIVEADFSIPDASLFNVPIGIVSGNFDYMDGKINIEKMTVEQEETHLDINGSLQISEQLPVQLYAKIAPLQISKYSKLFLGKDYPVSGLINGSISLYGPVQKLSGEGNLSITNGEIWGLKVDPFTLPLKLDSSKVNISNLVITSNEQKANLDLKIAQNGYYDFNLETQIYPVKLLQNKQSLLSGKTKLLCKAKGIGNVKNPEFDVALTLLDIYYAEKPFGDLHLSGNYIDDKLSLQGFALDKSLLIELESTIAESISYKIFLEGKDVELATFLESAAPHLAKKLDGKFDGEIQISGIFDASSVNQEVSMTTIESAERNQRIELLDNILDEMNFKVSASRLAFYGEGIDIINRKPIDLDFDNKVLHINSLELVNKYRNRSLLKMSGDINVQLDDTLSLLSSLYFSNFTISSEEFDFELANKVWQTEFPISGAPKFNLDLSGRMGSPDFTLKYQIPKLVINEQNANSMKLDTTQQNPQSLLNPLLNKPIEIENFGGKLVYSNNLLKIDCKCKPNGKKQLSRSKEVNEPNINEINIVGEIPIELSLTKKEFQERLLDKAMDVTITAKLDSKLVDYFLPEDSDLATSSGLFELKAKLGNIPRMPKFIGEIDFGNVNLVSTMLPQKIEKVRGNISFSANSSNIGNFDNIELALNTLDFSIGEADYKGKGRFWSSRERKIPQYFIFNFTGKNIELTPLVNHFTNSKYNFDGFCDAELIVTGADFNIDNINALLSAERFQINSSDSFTIKNIQPIKIRLRNSQLSFDSFYLGAPSKVISVTGQFCPFEGIASNNLLVSFHKLDLAKFISMLNFEYNFGGRLSSNIKIGGFAESPNIVANWKIDNLFKPETDSSTRSFVNEITGSLSYKDKVLSIEKTDIVLYNSLIHAEGDIPLDLTLTPKSVRERIIDEPLTLSLKGDNVKLSFLSSFSNLIEQTEGTAKVNLSLKGTTAKPYYEGTLSISEFFAKLSGFERPIKNGALKLDASQGIILLEHLSGHMELTSFLANGNIKMDGILPEVLNIENFKVQNAQINDFAKAFLSKKYSQHLFGNITTYANMKIDLAGEKSSREKNLNRFLNKFSDFSLIQNMSSYLRFDDVLIEWRDKENNSQYKISNLKEFEVNLKKQRLYFDFVLEDRTKNSLPLVITVKGDLRLNEKYFLDIDVANFDVTPLASSIDVPYDLSGLINSQLRVRGAPSSPSIDFNWNADDLTITKANIDRFNGNISYIDKKLKISSQTKISKNYAQLSALIPINISLQNFQLTPLDKNLEVQFDMKIDDFEFVPLIDEQLAYAEGNGEVNITMGGRVDNPAISGIARLDNVSFYLPGSNIEAKKTILSATIDRSGIKLKQLSGVLNGGNCRIEGEIIPALPPSPSKLDLNIDWTNCTFRTNAYWNLIKCDADLRVLGYTDRPVLEGSVVLDKIEYEQSFEELVKYWTSENVEIQTEAWYDYPLLRNMVLNVEVQAPNNLWAKTGPLKVEANAYGRMVGELGKPVFEGRIDILQGELWYLDHKFTINGGYLSNQNPYRFNPKYFLSTEIEEPIRNIELIDMQGESHVRDLIIYVNFSGYLQEHNPPELSAEVLHKGFGENYEFDRQQIISILTFGSADMFENEGVMTDTASVVLRKQAQLYVGNRLAKLIGFRSFRFDFTPDSLQQSRFLLTKDLTERWAITYSSTLQIYEEPYIELEYQINKHIAIKGERNEEGKFGVDLKFEYEFE